MTKQEKEIQVMLFKKPYMAEVVTIENQLEAMQNIVGVEGEDAYIEVVYLPIKTTPGREVVAVVDDEGKLKGLPAVAVLGSDILVGNFFVCASDFETGEMVSLNEDEMLKIRQLFNLIAVTHTVQL